MVGADDDFEQALIRAGRRAVPPSGAKERGWSRLEASLVGIAAGLVGHSLARTAAGRALAAKSMAVGVLLGCAATYAFLRPRSAPIPRAAPTLSAPSTSVSATTVASVAAPANVTPTIVSAVTSAASTVTALASAPASAAGPSLAAEIAAIDEARAALVAGAPDDALARVTRYRRDHPHGVLAPEATVVAIEAYAAKGDHAKTLAEAAAFLARHPHAPQAARVKALRATAMP